MFLLLSDKYSKVYILVRVQDSNQKWRKNIKMAEKNEILENRMKELSEKAKVEEQAEKAKAAIEATVSGSYKGITDSYDALNEKYSNALETTITETFMDHFRAENYSVKGFGSKLYDSIDKYFQKQVISSVPQDNDLAQIALKNLLSYVEEGKEQITEYIDSLDKLSHGVVEQIKDAIVDKLEGVINSVRMKEVKKLADKDLNGLKQYLKESAETIGIPFNTDKVTTVEIGLKKYTGLMDVLKKKKKEEQMLKRRFS